MPTASTQFHPENEMLFYVRMDFGQPLGSVTRATLENIWAEMVGADARRRMQAIWQEVMAERTEYSPVGQGSEDGVHPEA